MIETTVDIHLIEKARNQLDKRDPLRAKLSKHLGMCWKEIKKKKKDFEVLHLTAEEWEQIRVFKWFRTAGEN